MVYTINELGRRLNSGEVSGLYLLYGEEIYLKEYYKDVIIDEIKKKEGEGIEIVKVSGPAPVNDMYELVDTSSMFGLTKIIVIKNSNWFKSDSKEDIYEKYKFLIDSDGVYIIFLEENAAKNRKFYKAVEKNGICVEMAHQTGEMKEKWIAKLFKTNGINCDKNVCRYIADNCEPDMMNIKNEVEKLCLMKDPGDTVTIRDVDSVSIKILNSKIFALTDSITSKNARQALKTANDLTAMGEPMERIYFMIARYFRLMKQVKELVNEGSSSDAAAILKMNPYEASQFIKNSNKYSLETLKEAEKDCLDFDVARKNGNIDYSNAVELLIIKYCGRK